MREECETHVKEFLQDKITTLNFFLCREIILFSKHPANKDEYIDATRKNKLYQNLPERCTELTMCPFLIEAVVCCLSGSVGVLILSISQRFQSHNGADSYVQCTDSYVCVEMVSFRACHFGVNSSSNIFTGCKKG